MAGWTDILIGQLADPFRIGLIIALVFTMLRTEAVTGRLLPLLAGLVFVAVIIPSTMPSSSGRPLLELMAIGLVANAVLLAVVLGLRELYLRFR